MSKVLIDKEVVEQALEALSCSGEPDDPGHRCGACDDYVDRNGIVRSALRAVLEQSQEPVQLSPEDVTVETYAIQHGGFIFRPPNGVRLIHKPTGLVVQCDSDPSQYRNREAAWKELEKQLAEVAQQPVGQRQGPSQAPCSVAEGGVCEALECCKSQEPEQEPLQAGLTNSELIAQWHKKLPGAEPKDRDLQAFAVGAEVGFSHARELERQDWSRAWHAIKRAGVHPGRTDDHIETVIDRLASERDALRAALVQRQEPEQEPVGQLQEEVFGRDQVVWFRKPPDKAMLYTRPSPQPVEQRQEPQPPVDWEVFNTGAEVVRGVSFAEALDYLTPSRLDRGWSAVCVVNKDNIGAVERQEPAQEPVAEMSPEFTDSARAALLWLLWHHQGGSSPVGQPIRFALGLGQHESLTAQQIADARRWAASTGSTTEQFYRRENPAPQPVELTPAQQHAEELLEALQELLDQFTIFEPMILSSQRDATKAADAVIAKATGQGGTP